MLPPRMTGPQDHKSGDIPRGRGCPKPRSEITRLATHALASELGASQGIGDEFCMEGGIPAETEISEGGDGNDPMVTDPVQPFVIPVVLRNPHTGVSSTQGALIDSGCTRCLIRCFIANELGVQVLQLATPIRFEQIDGLVMGGAPATQVTELIKVEIGEHWEHLRFIVVDRMIEPLILGLTWLYKWQPVIWWEGGFRKLRFAIGPDPPPPD